MTEIHNVLDPTERPIHRYYFVLRIVQFILCFLCLAFGIYIALVIGIPNALKLIITITAAAFFLATLVDLTSMWLQNPLRWNSWILIAMTAAFFFFLCAGFMLAMYQRKKHAIKCQIFGVLNVLTAIAFLIDVIWIVTAIATRYTSVEPIEERERRPKSKPQSKESKRSSPSSCLPRPSSKKEKSPKTPKKEKPIKLQKSPTPTDKAVQYPSDGQLKRGKYTCTKSDCPRRFPPPVTTTYGGTFHVSKDAVPMPGPGACKCKPVKPTEPWKCLCEPRSSTADDISPPNTRKSSLSSDKRTVSVSTRYVPKSRESSIKSVPHSPTRACRCSDRSCRSAESSYHQSCTFHQNGNMWSTGHFMFPTMPCRCCHCAEKKSAFKRKSGDSASNNLQPEMVAQSTDTLHSYQSLPGQVSDPTQTECLTVQDKIISTEEVSPSLGCREVINDIIEELQSMEDPEEDEGEDSPTVYSQSGSGVYYYQTPCTCGRYHGAIMSVAPYPSVCMSGTCPYPYVERPQVDENVTVPRKRPKIQSEGIKTEPVPSSINPVEEYTPHPRISTIEEEIETDRTDTSAENEIQTSETRILTARQIEQLLPSSGHQESSPKHPSSAPQSARTDNSPPDSPPGSKDRKKRRKSKKHSDCSHQ